VVIPLRLSPQVMAEVEDILRRNLEYHLEQRLESAVLLKRLRAATLAGHGAGPPGEPTPTA